MRRRGWGDGGTVRQVSNVINLVKARSFTGVRLVSVAAEDSGGEEEDGSDQLEDTFYSNPNDAEWQEDQPDERVQDQQDQGHRPTDDQEEEPQQNGEHLALRYALAREKFDGFAGLVRTQTGLSKGSREAPDRYTDTRE